MRAKLFISGNQLLFPGLFSVLIALAAVLGFALPRQRNPSIEVLMSVWDPMERSSWESSLPASPQGLGRMRPEKQVASKFLIAKDGYYAYALDNFYAEDRKPIPSLVHLNTCQFRQRMTIFSERCSEIPILFSFMPDVRYQRFVDVLSYCRHFRVRNYALEKLSEFEQAAIECYAAPKSPPCNAPTLLVRHPFSCGM
jgi:hypothetical protein